MRHINVLTPRYATYTQWLRWSASLLVILSLCLGTFATSVLPARAAAYCEVDYTPNSWNTGFTASVKIYNLSGAAINGWDLTWSFTANEHITNAWNANVTQTGVNVSAKNMSYNGTIGVGGNVEFGFQGTHGGSVGAIANVKVNGVACGDEGDTVPPTVPTGLASPSKTATSVNLTWTASTDNVGVAGYDIYSGGVLVGSSATTAYVDTGLTASTTYQYQVRARDAAGNVSALSAALSVTTNSGVDTEPPTVPTGLASPSKTATSVNLTWTASTDNVGVAGYDIYRGGVLVGSSATTAYVDTGLTASTTYQYQVRAKDAAGNVSALSAALSVTTNSGVDTEPPTVPAGLASPSQTTTSVNLIWAASTDNVAVTGYDIYRNGTLVGASATTSYVDTGLAAGTAYQYRVRARDAAGNASALCTAITATTKAEATGACLVTYDTPRTWSGGFNIQNVYIKNLGAAAINGWTLTFRFTNGEQVSSAWNATVTQSGVTVSAVNVSHNAAIAPGATVAFGFNGSQTSGVGPLEAFQLNGMSCGDAEPPTAPTNLSSPSQAARSIDLTWSPSTDNAGVTGYIIYRGGVAVGTSATTSFTDSGLSPETTYVYTVVARDAAGNFSDPSNALSVATQAGQPSAVFRVNSDGRITKDGQVFPVQCGSWFGLEGRHEPSNDATNPSGAPMELYMGNTFWANGGAGTGRTIQQDMEEITAMGINMVRLPVVPQTLHADDPQGMAPYLKNHPSVRVPNARQALEEFIVLADQNGIEVLLDMHSCSNYIGWRAGRLDARPPYADATRDNYDFTRETYSCAATNNPSSVTTIHAYDVNQWLDDLRTLAGLGEQLGVDNIIGIDIFNEPWDYTWEEWKTLSELAYAAINEVNPNTLIFIQGISATADNQDGSPTTITQVPHGDTATNPNWGENLYEAGANPPNIPQSRLVYSPHTYGPSVFVQKMFMDPAQSQCAGLEGDAAGNANCNIVINPTLLRQGWEEHFGYLRDMGYAVVVGEFGGNLEWPGGAASLRDQALWSHITPGVDAEWQTAFVDYMVENELEGCYWSINPESGDTGGWYDTTYDPVSNASGWGEWLDFIQAKTDLLFELWGAN